MSTMMLDPRPSLADASRSVELGWLAIRWFVGVVGSIRTAVEVTQLRHRTVKTLNALDDRTLRDIGVRRDAIAGIAREVGRTDDIKMVRFAA